MGLIHRLEEQISIEFTGKVNILGQENSQFMGVVLFQDGDIVDCKYEVLVGEKALLHLIVDDVTSKRKFRFVVEPEIVSLSKHAIDFKHLKKRASQIVERFVHSKNLRPPEHLNLLIPEEFISEKKERYPSLNSGEFKVLCAIVDYSNVKDIYSSLNLHEYEITDLLVSLRKKKAVKVVG